MTTSEIHAVVASLRQQVLLAPLVLAVLLLAIDVTFITTNYMLLTKPGLWSVEADHGYPEKFQHLKWLVACLLLLGLALRRRAAIYLGWAAVFLYFLFDDARSLHETLGLRFVTDFGLTHIHEVYMAWFPDWPLRPRDFGELLMAIFVAAAIAMFLLMCWPGRNARDELRLTKRLIAWLALFAVFAVGIDMIHIMIQDWRTRLAFGLLEDGGEMICASLLVGMLAFEHARRPASL